MRIVFLRPLLIKKEYLYMLKTILAVSGKPGLYKLISQAKNMLIVESLVEKKRTPVYASDKVISLGDIAMYTNEGDVSLANVLETIKQKEKLSNYLDSLTSIFFVFCNFTSCGINIYIIFSVIFNHFNGFLFIFSLSHNFYLSFGWNS